MEGSPRRREELPLQQVLGAISECHALGIQTLFITGGEPLLYHGLPQVLEAAASSPGIKTTVCTNGMLLSSGQAALFHDYEVRVNISIDGPPEFHDRFRNLTGAFGRSERGVKAAVQAGVPVTIITTVSKANLDSLEFVVNWAAKIGAEQFFAQPLLDLGRGTQIASQCLSFDEVNRLILRLTDLANQPRTENLKCSVIGARRKFLLEHPCGAYVCNGGSCHRGVEKEIKKVVVRENGTVLPEVPNLSPLYSLGNIQDGPLTELIERYYEHGYNSFDRLCRSAYSEVLQSWDCVIVPWEQIIAERSRTWIPEDDCILPAPQCCDCRISTYGAWKRDFMATSRGSAGTRKAERLLPISQQAFADVSTAKEKPGALMR
jgi:Fe-coproporphyrin III synthase